VLPPGRAFALVLAAAAVGLFVAAALYRRRRVRVGAGALAAALFLAGAVISGAFATLDSTASASHPVTTVGAGGVAFDTGYNDVNVALGAAATPQTPSVSGGATPYTFSANPPLLGGLTLDANTGEISGTAGGVVAQLAVGGHHTCARFFDGSVKCWGLNDLGQLGLGDTASRGDAAGEMGDALASVPLGTGRTAVALAAGGNHTCALLDNDTVKCWGSNAYGQLGLGDTDDRGDEPGEMGDALGTVPLGTGRTAVALSAGGAHTCALLDDDTVKCWGYNGPGTLGLGDTDARGDAGGELGDALPAVALGTGRTAVAVAAGGEHTCALLDDASVKCWGKNTTGQLGLGDAADRGDAGGELGDALPAVALGAGRTAVALSAGGLHTCALLDDSTVKCWGSTLFGQLGLEDAEDRGDESGEMGDALPSVPLGTGRSAVSMMAGPFHTCARLDNAALKCWGVGTNGQLGLGNMLAIGDAAGEMADNLPAVSLGTGRTADAVGLGVYHTCALLDDDSVKCWGGNDAGRLGLGHTNARGDNANEMGDLLPRPALGTFSRPSTITVTDANSATDTDTLTVTIVSGSGSLPSPSFDTGYDDIAVGVGDAVSPQTPSVSGGVVPRTFSASPALLGGLSLNTSTGEISGTMGGNVAELAAGSQHTCARFDDGRVKCWGENSFGQLGLGDTEARGDEANEMFDDLPFVSLGTGRTAVDIEAGAFHTCAVLDNGSVKCWGDNASGQLGLGDTEDRGDAGGEMGDALPAASLGSGRTAVAVSAGAGYTCAILDDASVKCWGENGKGQLGLGDTNDRGDASGEMGDALPAVSLGAGRTAVAITAGAEHACALLDDASAKCWGENFLGQLGLGDTNDRGDGANEMGDDLPVIALGTGRSATAIVAGALHTCAVLDNGSVKCWGYNQYGSLGLGDTDHRGDGGGEMGDALAAVSLGTGRTASALVAGFIHTCAVLDNGSVKCWGGNDNGQLGLGDTAHRGDGGGEMGDALPALALGTGRTAIDGIAGLSHMCVRLDDASVKCWGLNDNGELGQGDTTRLGDDAVETGDALARPALGTFTRNTTVTVTDDNGRTGTDTLAVTLTSDHGQTVPAVPDAPTLTPGYRSVSVAWSYVSGASRYDLQRSVGGGAYDLYSQQLVSSPFADSSLVDNTSYGYKVRACNAAGCSAWSSPATATTAPAIPSLSVSVSGTTGSPSWGAVTGASHYDLQVTGAGGITSIADDFNRADANSGMGETSTGAKTWFQVGTWGIGGNEAYLVSNGNPSAATIDLGSPDGFVQFTLGADARNLQGVVFRYADLSNYWRAVYVAGVASWRIDKRVGGVWTQHNAFGFGAYTDGTVIRIEFDGDQIRAYVNGVLSTTVTDANLAANTRVGLYHDTEAASGSSRWDAFATGQLPATPRTITDLTGTTYNDTGLATGTTYSYQIRACNVSDVCSDWSGAQTGTSSLWIPWAATQPFTTSQVQLSWGEVSGATSYEYAHRTPGSSWPAATSTTSTLVFVGSLIDWDYDFRVRACRAGVCGPWKTTTGYPIPAAAPNNVTSLVATAGNTEVALSWQPNLKSYNITGYRVHAKIGGVDIAGSPKTVSPMATAYTYTGLTNGQAYTFTVDAQNSFGWNSGSTSGSVTPAAGTQSLAPDAILASTNLTTPTVAAIEDDPDIPDGTWIACTTPTVRSDLRVSFPTPAAGTLSGTQTFQVWARRLADGAAALKLHLVEGGVTLKSSAGTNLNTTGTLVTTTWNPASDGLSDMSGAAVELRMEQSSGTVSCVEFGAVEWIAAPGAFATPGAPTSVSGSAGSASATVTWNAPSSTGGATISNYRVTVYSASGGTPVGIIGSQTREVGSTATSYTFDGLKPGVAYTFKVEALNAKGWGTASSASSSVTPTW